MMKTGTSFYKDSYKRNDGFTLVELLAVLVILAMLAAVSMPAMTGYVEDARKKSYLAEAFLARAAVSEYMAEQDAGGSYSDTAFYEDILSTKLSDENNALTEVLRGSYTPGAWISSVACDRKTKQIIDLVYCVDRYEIEIKGNGQAEFRERN